MRVIGTVGLPASGKGEAAAVAREEGVPVVTMGDVVREACRERGLDPAAHHGEVARTLREEHGPAAVAERSLPAVEAALSEAAVVLVDGLRSPVEVEAFEEAFGDEFLLVSVEAPFELRADRIADRGRDAGEEAGGETLRERDERERGFGVEEAMERADVTVENTGPIESLRSEIRALLRESATAREGAG